MKKILTILLFSGCLAAQAQTHKITQIWATDTIVAIPESVLPDIKNNFLYVSLIDGGPWDADGKGGIGRMNKNGTNYDSLWFTGLNAPKGLGIWQNKIYAADISNVVVADISTGKLIRKIPVEGASGLNDITISAKGLVFVSDSKTGKIWKLENEIPALYLEDITGANGLKSVGEDLYFAKGSLLMKADGKKQVTRIADVSQSIDGIEPIGNGDFLVTSWPGYIFYVYANGKSELLLDTHNEKKNTADLGYDPIKKILYVPTFFNKRVVAYQLNSQP